MSKSDRVWQMLVKIGRKLTASRLSPTKFGRTWSHAVQSWPKSDETARSGSTAAKLGRNPRARVWNMEAREAGFKQSRSSHSTHGAAETSLASFCRAMFLCCSPQHAQLKAATGTSAGHRRL